MAIAHGVSLEINASVSHSETHHALDHKNFRLSAVFVSFAKVSSDRAAVMKVFFASAASPPAQAVFKADTASRKALGFFPRLEPASRSSASQLPCPSASAARAR